MRALQTITKSADIVKLSDAELMQAIRNCLQLTIEHIEHFASLIREARRRNMSLAEFSTGMPRRMVAVADKKLAAELVFKFADQPTKIDALFGVPVEKQREIASGEKIAVVEPCDTSESGFRTVTKTLREMTPPQVRQVFSYGHQRTPTEQKKQHTLIMDASRKHRETARRAVDAPVRVVADVASSQLLIGSHRINLTALVGALKLLGYRLERIKQ